MGQTGMRRLLGAAVVAGIVGLLAAACGGGGDDGGNGDEPTKPPAATAPASSTEPASNGEPSATVDLVEKDTLFDKTKLVAKAGTVTFNVDNQDAGIVHNLHIYKGKDNTGESMGATELEAGPGKQQLVLELEAGEYFFVCEAHPATMAGTLEVK